MAIILSLLILAGISTGFLALQETRDFRIAKNLDIFFTLFRELNTFYVDEINPDKVIKTGIDNMLKSLDPYTVYYPESDADEFTFLTTGKYGGIGSLVRGSGEYRCNKSKFTKVSLRIVQGSKPEISLKKLMVHHLRE